MCDCMRYNGDESDAVAPHIDFMRGGSVGRKRGAVIFSHLLGTGLLAAFVFLVKGIR